jgi:hypothetical protein
MRHRGGIFLNDMPLGPRKTFIDCSRSFDLDRVEALRGPQGNLPEQDALGGAPIVATSPAATFSGRCAGGCGDRAWRPSYARGRLAGPGDSRRRGPSAAGTARRRIHDRVDPLTGTTVDDTPIVSRLASANAPGNRPTATGDPLSPTGRPTFAIRRCSTCTSPTPQPGGRNGSRAPQPFDDTLYLARSGCGGSRRRGLRQRDFDCTTADVALDLSQSTSSILERPQRSSGTWSARGTTGVCGSRARSPGSPAPGSRRARVAGRHRRVLDDLQVDGHGPDRSRRLRSVALRIGQRTSRRARDCALGASEYDAVTEAPPTARRGGQ